MNISVCGIDCSICKFKIKNKCEGCRTIAPIGMCVWGGRCELYDCASSKNIPHCGKCEVFPCEKLITAHKNENPDGNGIEIENLKALGD